MMADWGAHSGGSTTLFTGKFPACGPCPLRRPGPFTLRKRLAGMSVGGFVMKDGMEDRIALEIYREVLVAPNGNWRLAAGLPLFQGISVSRLHLVGGLAPLGKGNLGV